RQAPTLSLPSQSTTPSSDTPELGFPGHPAVSSAIAPKIISTVDAWKLPLVRNSSSHRRPSTSTLPTSRRCDLSRHVATNPGKPRHLMKQNSPQNAIERVLRQAATCRDWPRQRILTNSRNELRRKTTKYAFCDPKFPSRTS